MKRLIFALILTGASLNAGIIRVATYPVRHPVKTTKAVLKVIY